MNAAGPELRDIHLPAEPLWWPPAPGWWLLLLALLAFALALPWLWRRFGPVPFKQAALRELVDIRRSLGDGHTDNRRSLDAVSRLMRRVAIDYRGRMNAASNSGDAWVENLEQLSPRRVFSESQLEWLAHGRYRPQQEIDAEALIDACEKWIRSLPREHRHAAA